MSRFGRATGKTTRKILNAITCILRNRQSVIFVTLDRNTVERTLHLTEGVLEVLGVSVDRVEDIVSVTTLEHGEKWHIRFVTEREWEKDKDIILARDRKAHVIDDL